MLLGFLCGIQGEIVSIVQFLLQFGALIDFIFDCSGLYGLGYMPFFYMALDRLFAHPKLLSNATI